MPASRGNQPASLPLRLGRLLLPPLCPGCGRALTAPLLCGDCHRELNRAPVLRHDPPPGVAAIVSCAPHEGVARRVLVAYKFRGIMLLEDPIAGYMADLAGPPRPGMVVVPIPASPLRRRLRGFDPAARLATRIAGALEPARLDQDCLVRRGTGRQRGRGRAGRLGNPPDIRPVPGTRGPAGHPALLVDDVITTGATLAAAAAALKDAGSGPVFAVTFTRRL